MQGGCKTCQAAQNQLAAVEASLVVQARGQEGSIGLGLDFGRRDLDMSAGLGFG